MEFFWIVAIGIGVVVVLSLVFHTIREKKRTQAWQDAAQQLGMEYFGDQNDTLSRFGYFRLLRKGRSQRVTNVISADSGDVRITLADLSYRTGSHKNRRTHHRTICVLESDKLDVPHCYLRPEVMVFDSLGSLFGGQDIDFADDREFSNAYVLQGDNEEAIRELFNSDLRAWFAERRGQNFHFETQGRVLLFHTGKRRRPGEARELMEQALQILKRLSGRA